MPEPVRVARASRFNGQMTFNARRRLHVRLTSSPPNVVPPSSRMPAIQTRACAGCLDCGIPGAIRSYAAQVAKNHPSRSNLRSSKRPAFAALNRPYFSQKHWSSASFTDHPEQREPLSCATTERRSTSTVTCTPLASVGWWNAQPFSGGSAISHCRHRVGQITKASWRGC